ncbi:hypothetical protein [Candidatus Palauibacter sp.]|uniref:hypothetical protein n=1 Tax=Candidatus Palauibacter sp. TaxID=3101350 RepID=UPI003B515981
MKRILLLALLLSGCDKELVLDGCGDVTTLVPYSVEGPDAVQVNREAIYALEGGMPQNVEWWLCGRNTDRPTSSDCVSWYYTGRDRVLGRYGQLDGVGDGTHRVVYRAPAEARDVWIVATVVLRSTDPFCPPAGEVRKMVRIVGT